MTELLLFLRVASALLWVLVMIYLWRPMVRSVRAEHRRNLDPIWAIAWCLAANRIWFVVWNTAAHPAPDPAPTGGLVFGYITACALSILLIKVRGWYGD